MRVIVQTTAMTLLKAGSDASPDERAAKRSEAAHPPTRNGPPLCIPDLLARRKSFIDFGLERPLEKGCRNQQRADSENKQEQQIGLNGHESSILQQNRFESVNRIRKRIDNRNRAQPFRKRRNRRYGS